MTTAGAAGPARAGAPPTGTARSRRAATAGAVLALAVLAGLEYAWGSRTAVLEPYYAAAVRSMAASWHNFAYGSFDPAATVTVDKLPGALWLQALSVRAFGLHVWAIVAPQVAEGVLTVVFLFLAVRRLAGTAAGLGAAAVLVAMPVNTALDRGNISDSLLVLLGVLAADAAGRAVTDGRWRWVLLSGVWIGLAFQAKMAQAWLLAVPLGVTYLWFGPRRPARRLAQAGASTALAGAVSLAWVVGVSLQPEGGRPYVDGSTHDSLFQQVFQYDGLSRFGGGGLLGPRGTPTSLVARLVGPSILDFTLRSPPSWHRLLSGAGGREIGWLVPAALLAAGALLVGRRRSPPTVTAAVVLWSVWLGVHLLVFSTASTINAYYPAVITPAVAALVGIGASEVWRRRERLPARLGAAAAILLSAGYSVWLLDSAGYHTPLGPALAAAGVVGAAAVAAPAALGGRSGRPGHRAPGPPRWKTTLFQAGLLLGAASGLAAPAVGSVWLVRHHLGPFDSPYESAGLARVTQSAPLQDSPILRLTVNALQRLEGGTRYVFATDSSLVAAPFIFGTGAEVLPVGGFTGRLPSPTLEQLRRDIARGRLRFVLAGRTTDPRFVWIAAHCRSLDPKGRSPAGAPIGLYLCLPAAADLGGG